jgi:hypothetical protein
MRWAEEQSGLSDPLEQCSFWQSALIRRLRLDEVGPESLIVDDHQRTSVPGLHASARRLLPEDEAITHRLR